MDWKFLLYLLRRCGFGEKCCSWIERCISMARFSVLISDTPSGFFSCSKGVRQGDPLSPFLFVIVMEAFSMMIATAIDHGRISSFSVRASLFERVNISHLLFADDNLVFCGGTLDQIRSIKATCLF
jgi:hypothetical protein